MKIRNWRNPFGVDEPCGQRPGVAPSSEPWAERGNPFWMASADADGAASLPPDGNSSGRVISRGLENTREELSRIAFLALCDGFGVALGDDAAAGVAALPKNIRNGKPPSASTSA